MKISSKYNLTFDSMLQEYDEKPAFYSDEYKRLSAMAKEISSLWYEIEQYKKQTFIETATGEFLNLHAAEHGIERGKAKKSHGIIELVLQEAAEEELIIPEGSVFADENGNEFVTVEEKRIEKGSVAAEVLTESVLPGEKMNISSNKIKIKVSAPEWIETVRNNSAFIGGTDEECDESLRKRILKLCEFIPTGRNRDYYLKTALKFNEIKSLGISSEVDNGKTKVKLYVYGNGTEVSEDIILTLEEKLKQEREPLTDIKVLNATPVGTDILLYVKGEKTVEFALAKAEAEKIIDIYFSELGINDDFILSELTAKLMSSPLIKNVRFSSAVEDAEGAENLIYTKGEITVREQE